jgi:hypothetical protein
MASATDISNATPLSLVAEIMNMDFTLDLSAILQDGSSVPTVQYDCSAVYYIETKDARSTFVFYTDDLLELNTGSDSLQFGVNTSSAAWSSLWNAPFDAVNAQCLDPSAIDLQSATGSINKNMVCHDFVRYLAKKLFHNAKGTDLFKNQNQLLQHLRSDAITAWSGVTSILSDPTKAGGVLHGTDMLFTSADTSSNISYQLFQQIIQADPIRFQNLTADGHLEADAKGNYPIPFTDGDVLSFTLTISPAAGQEAVTQLGTAIPARTYLINLVMMSEGEPANLNPVPDVAESV